MKIIQANEIIGHVAATIRGWGQPNPYGVRTMGGVFEYYEELNRRGQFKTPVGRPVVLDAAELRLALELAAVKQ
jgi:hypothetical protein